MTAVASLCVFVSVSYTRSCPFFASRAKKNPSGLNAADRTSPIMTPNTRERKEGEEREKEREREGEREKGERFGGTSSFVGSGERVGVMNDAHCMW